ncbi:MAG TPA: hypothetical protein VFX49_06810 [Chloroflexota bacterium]|nr:hypothetical protein [Chloroflexota bacterium]
MSPTVTSERRDGVTVAAPGSVRPAAAPWERSAGVPLRRSLAGVFTLSLLVAGLMAGATAVGLRSGAAGVYGADPAVAAGITASTAGILVPGFFAHDVLNLAVALPLLLAAVWLAWRGSLAGILLLPGVLFYALYTYAQYLVGAPLGPLFLAHVLLVVLSAYATICLIAAIDGDAVRSRLEGSVPARAAGGILVALALLTLGQDAVGALATALAGGAGGSGGAAVEPFARHAWTADLALEVPAVLTGGVLLWRRRPLGYVVGAGLLLQFGLTPIVLAAIVALQPWLTGAPAATGTIAGVLIFAAVPFAPLAFFVRAATRAGPARGAL